MCFFGQKNLGAGIYEGKPTKFEGRKMPVAVLAEVPAESGKCFEKTFLAKTKLEQQKFVFESHFYSKI